jgi:hypothetical protein
VCELDIIFNFEQAYYILDEFVLGGEVQETSKKNVLKAIAAQDLLQEVLVAFIAYSTFTTVVIAYILIMWCMRCCAGVRGASQSARGAWSVCSLVT